MEKKTTNTVGSIKISVDVLLKIAETAACEVDGVACEGQRLVCEGAVSKLKGAVNAKISGETAALRIRLVVLDGFNAVSVSQKVQKSVKSAVQSMTGFAVTKVDVEVAGVQFKDIEE